MRFSLRTLLIAGMLGPPVLALLYAAWSWDPLGNGGPELVPVRGVVSLDGQPVADVAVIFAFEDGNFANGITDEKGEYLLGFMGYVGCPLEPAKVWIHTRNGMTPGGVTIPARYTDWRQTPLTAHPKKEKANRIDFKLTSP